MNTRRFTLALFASVAFFAASHSAQAATKKEKADERAAALVAALQAVSPDPLGGRLGLAITTPRTETAPAAGASSVRSLPLSTDRDHLAYLSWKKSSKS